VTITETDWTYFTLGIVTIPPGGRMLGGADGANYATLGLAAERISGSGYLEMDCLVLIPMSEGFVSVAHEEAGLWNGDTSVIQYADGKSVGGMTYSTLHWGAARHQIVGGLPIGNGIVVIAADRGNQSVKTDTVDVDISAMQRWRGLRGNET
jgi:hypothetical protein